jgi:hypothetical protein
MSNRARQLGLSTVEFAIVGAVLVTVMFAALEFGRIIFTMNVLQEAARRGARVAAVCRVGDAGVTAAATFIDLRPLDAGHVRVEYLGANGELIGAPAQNYGSIHYVRVRIVDVEIPIAIPFINPTFAAPEFSATLPRESLGIPKTGEPPAC